MVAESLVSMLPTPRPVRFPGDPPPTLSRVEQRQSETSREQTRVSLTAFSDTDVEHRQQRCTPSPYLSQVLWHRAVLVAAQHCLHLLRFIWAGVILTQSLVLNKQGSSGSWSAYKSSPVHFACSMKATQREGEVSCPMIRKVLKKLEQDNNCRQNYGFHLGFLPMVEISGYTWVCCSHCRLVCTVQLICRVKGFVPPFMMTDQKLFTKQKQKIFESSSTALIFCLLSLNLWAFFPSLTLIRTQSLCLVELSPNPHPTSPPHTIP